MSLYNHDYNNRIRDLYSPKEERSLFSYAIVTMIVISLALLALEYSGGADWIINYFK